MPKQVKELAEERELSTRKCDSYGNYEIYYIGGGQIPRELTGIYTSKTLADRRLAGYLATKGIIDEKNKLKESIKSITPLDHEYDEV